MPNPFENPDLYVAPVVAGVRMPGMVTLSGLVREEKWDIKEGAGQSGATTTRKGESLAPFSASTYLVIDPVLGIDEYAEWDVFLGVLRSSTSGKTPRALDFYHPDASDLGVKSVVVTKISGKTYDGKGGATVTVDFLEYRPPQPKGGSPSGSTSKSGADGKTPPPDPNADLKKELDSLLEKAKSL